MLITSETETAIRNLFSTILGNARRGFGFTSPYFTIQHSIKGTFDNEDDFFDYDRHDILINVGGGAPFRKRRELVIETQKVGAPDEPRPIARKVFDKKTKSNNTYITAGGVAELKGGLLKIYDTEDPNQGIFLTRMADQEVFRVDYYYKNRPSFIEFDVPEGIGAGMFMLEVRSAAYKGSTSIRTGNLNVELESTT